MTRVRILSGMILAAVIGVMAGDPPAALAQKKKTTKPADRYATVKKAQAVQPSLPDGTKLTAVELATHIDKMISRRLATEKVTPSPRCTDEEFLRRVYIDITGKIPTQEQAVAFLDSKDPQKRAKLIDELLANKAYGTHLADIWQALLLPRDSGNVRLRQWYPNLTKWMEEQFNSGTGWDKIAREIVTATGDVAKTSPAVYWVANNTADKATDNITRNFLGVELQCAQCHNHPFTDFKQTDYWGMAAFFLRVGPDGNPKGAAKKGNSVSIGEKGKARRQKLPESAKILAPKFLQGDLAKVSPTGAVRPVLADWMTSASNPYFSRAMTNRLWGHFFGRGIVNPVNDMIDTNEASHPELLADLAQQFAASGFDVKHLIRAICNSETYQRSSKPIPGNSDFGPELFARMAVKPLTPGQLYDSLMLVVGTEGRRAVPKAKGRLGTTRDQFVAFFAAEDGADPTEYHAGIPQVLRLMNAPQLNGAAVLNSILRSTSDQDQVLEKLYLTVLARRPRAEEVDMMKAFLRKNQGEQRQAYAGVLWVLMNSSEFALNR
jgi:hypothetical protein